MVIEFQLWGFFNHLDDLEVACDALYVFAGVTMCLGEFINVLINRKLARNLINFIEQNIDDSKEKSSSITCICKIERTFQIVCLISEVAKERGKIYKKLEGYFWFAHNVLFRLYFATAFAFMLAPCGIFTIIAYLQKPEMEKTDWKFPFTYT